MEKELKAAFINAYTLFNAGEYDQLVKVFHPDIVMKRVDDPDSICGVGNVVAYLNGQQKELKPQLKPVKYEPDPPSPRSATYGQVSGTAVYYDSEKAKSGLDVRFIFTFTRKDEDSSWLLINTFAAPTL
jgi:hypothetical protein